MPTLAGTVFGLIAACSFDADAAAAAYRVQSGFTSAITRNGAGDYTLTLLDAANLNTSCVITAGINAATAGMIGVEPLTTTTLRVRSLDSAAMAADRDFWLQIQKIAP